MNLYGAIAFTTIGKLQDTFLLKLKHRSIHYLSVARIIRIVNRLVIYF
jgi:hypothetical protein